MTTPPASSPEPPRILLASLRGYRRAWLRADLLAGLTVWAVLVPESLAYASIAGVPPVVGLYAARCRLSCCTRCSAPRGVGYAEGLGAAKTYAAREGYDVDPNRELLGMGAANLGAGLGSGMVVNGSLSKTAVNGAAVIALAGARTFNRAGR